ncbi:phosphoadenosine phosphosulfate reductase [Frigidibacter sp. ROC022]|uniref:phosphoadenosine phosphosulfate reductase n=1 Tax=Frigidibacter sp. ROC022 TaxID=2971796 RepID=UPI00215A3DA3|nr:phosphoadenosine phosphosulfate reductase [Frigidibacter sp. ROC022]MCR8726811.1 phosphoadenosine phosphosulfate reductase [Frigidibacter sp. ROC022]
MVTTTDPAAQAAELAGLDDSAWLEALDAIAEERGYFEPVGPDHAACFTDEGPVLLVTFETMTAARARPDQLPQGFSLADARGWSQLTILARDETWFRDRRVYGYFDRLVDDGFFEDFDRVIFYGAGMCGYAACAFSVAAPGATVLAVQPYATLDPLRAGWDRRHRDKRRLNFTDRYGFAPHMIEAADRAFLFYDPQVDADAIHASFFTCPNTSLVRMPMLGDNIASDLVRMQVLDTLLDEAAEGLRPAAIHRALRARKRYLPYLRNLIGRLRDSGQWMRLAKVTRLLTERYGGRRFQKLHDEALTRLKAAGQTLPPRPTARRPVKVS